jgi:hypothetical protein
MLEERLLLIFQNTNNGFPRTMFEPKGPAFLMSASHNAPIRFTMRYRCLLPNFKRHTTGSPPVARYPEGRFYELVKIFTTLAVNNPTVFERYLSFHRRRLGRLSARRLLHERSFGAWIDIIRIA